MLILVNKRFVAFLWFSISAPFGILNAKVSGIERNSEIDAFDLQIGTTWEDLVGPYPTKGYTQFDFRYLEKNEKLRWCVVEKIVLRGWVQDKKVAKYDLYSSNSSKYGSEKEMPGLSLDCLFYDDKVQITEMSPGEVCKYSMKIADRHTISEFEGVCVNTDAGTGKQTILKYAPVRTNSGIGGPKLFDLDAPIEFPALRPSQTTTRH